MISNAQALTRRAWTYSSKQVVSNAMHQNGIATTARLVPIHCTSKAYRLQTAWHNGNADPTGPATYPRAHGLRPVSSAPLLWGLEHRLWSRNGPPVSPVRPVDLVTPAWSEVHHSRFLPAGLPGKTMAGQNWCSWMPIVSTSRFSKAVI